MSDIDAVQPLTGERYPNESDAAVTACNDYLRMGLGRSLRTQLDDYRLQTAYKPPTVRFKTLSQWSSDFNWQERAKAYDAQVDREKNEALARRRKEIMESGLSLDFERIAKLKRLAELLEGEIYQENENHPHLYEKLWLEDVKQIGAGPLAHQVEIYRYNSALVDDYRGILDDLAKETGGRKIINELTGKDGAPLKAYVVTNDFNPDEA